MMGIESDIFLEGKTNNELEKVKQKQGRSYFNFLQLLTENRFNHLPVQNRLKKILTLKPEIKIEVIPDKVLEKLYIQANESYRRYCSGQFSRSGYEQTLEEKQVLVNLKQILAKNPKRYSAVQICPRDLVEAGGIKMRVGGHLPDIVLRGITKKGCGLIILEVDGPPHDAKSRKDNYYYRSMEDLGAHVYPIYNSRANKRNELKQLLDSLQVVNTTDLKNKEKRCLRKLWCYTIAYHYSLEELQIQLEKFGLKIDLVEYFDELIRLEGCPRPIRREHSKLFKKVKKRSA